MSKLRVTTYNIQSGRSNHSVSVRNFDNCIKVISELDSDIVGLEEVGKHPTSGFPEYIMDGEPADYIAAKLGMNGYFAPAIKFRDKYYYGNALVTKFPIKNAKTVGIPDPEKKEENGYYETRAVLVAELDVPDMPNGLTVLVSHFGLMHDEHVNAVNTVVELIKSIKTPIIFMGDLNMTPENPLFDPIYELISDTCNREATPITWPSDLDKDVGEYEAKIKCIEKHGEAARRIDYIFTTDELKVIDKTVTHSLASDHMPYTVELEY